MTQHYNRTSQKNKRRELRKNQTFAEKVMWSCLRNKKLLGYKFKRQYSVDYYVIDFYCPEIKLAIELDGESHDSDEKKEYDRERQNYLESFGIKFFRITNESFLGNPNKVFEILEAEIKKIAKEQMQYNGISRELSITKI